jgi:hypothetical protein
MYVHKEEKGAHPHICAQEAVEDLIRLDVVEMLAEREPVRVITVFLVQSGHPLVPA